MLARIWTRHENVVSLVAFAVLFGILALMRGMAIDWDLLDYHYYNGYAFLHGRHFYDLAPAMVQSFQNPFYDVINYVLVSSQPAGFVVFENGAITGISAFLTYRLAMTVLSPTNPVTRRLYALAAVVIAMSAAGNSSTLGYMTNDSKMGLLAVASLYALVQALLEPKARRQRNWLLIGGALAGLGMAFKLVAGVYAIGFGVGLVVCRRPSWQHFWACLTYGIAALAAFALAEGPWMYYLWRHFGNPLFPYYNDIFHSPWIEPRRFNDPGFYPINIWHSVIDWATNLDLYGRDQFLDSRPLAVCLLAAVALGWIIVKKILLKRKLNLPWLQFTSLGAVWRLLIVSSLVCYTIWYESFTIYRYLVTFEMVVGIFIVALVLELLPYFVLRALALAWLSLFLIHTTHLLGLGHVAFGSPYAALTQKTFTLSKAPEVPDDAIILLNAPTAYLISSFPKKARFIGTNFVFGQWHPPEVKSRYSEMGLRFMEASPSSLYILAGSEQMKPHPPLNEQPFILWFLDAYRYEISGSCQEFTSNVSTDGVMRLCPIAKKR